MSRPKHYWYGFIRKVIMIQDTLNRDNSMQEEVLLKAIEDANNDTRKLNNGELRLRAVDEILVKQVMTYDGVAMEMHYDWRTIQNWVNQYTILVGRKAGFN